MRIDLSDLDRLESFAFAFGRLFWCLMALAFFAALLGSAGTGLLVLILGAAAFVARVGLEDFVRARRDRADLPPEGAESPITLHRTRGARRGAARTPARSR